MSDQRPPAASLRRPLFRNALLYLLPTVISGLVALTGARSATGVGSSLGLPWMIAGLGGLAGSVTILAAALRADHAITHDRADPVTLTRLASVARLARVLMLAAAVATAIAGIALAPTGLDRGLAIVVNTGLAVALALFALMANDLEPTLQ